MYLAINRAGLEVNLSEEAIEIVFPHALEIDYDDVRRSLVDAGFSRRVIDAMFETGIQESALELLRERLR